MCVRVWGIGSSTLDFDPLYLLDLKSRGDFALAPALPVISSSEQRHFRQRTTKDSFPPRIWWCAPPVEHLLCVNGSSTRMMSMKGVTRSSCEIESCHVNQAAR